MSILALFATFTLFAFTSSHKYCCNPERYSARSLIKSFIGGELNSGTGELYFDYAAGIYAAFANISSITSSSHYDLNSDTVYIVTGGDCIKQKVDKSLIKNIGEPHCIPDSANLEYTFSLGGPHEDVELQSFLQIVGSMHRHAVVTKHHCYPVQEILVNTEKTEDGDKPIFSMMTTIADMKLSIDDPSVLVIPEICQKSTLSTEELPVGHLKFIPIMASL